MGCPEFNKSCIPKEVMPCARTSRVNAKKVASHGTTPSQRTSLAKPHVLLEPASTVVLSST